MSERISINAPIILIPTSEVARATIPRLYCRSRQYKRSVYSKGSKHGTVLELDLNFYLARKSKNSKSALAALARIRSRGKEDDRKIIQIALESPHKEVRLQAMQRLNPLRLQEMIPQCFDKELIQAVFKRELSKAEIRTYISAVNFEDIQQEQIDLLDSKELCELACSYYYERNSKAGRACYFALDRLTEDRDFLFVSENARSDEMKKEAAGRIRDHNIIKTVKEEELAELERKRNLLGADYCTRCDRVTKSVTYIYDHSHGADAGEIHCVECNAVKDYIKR